MLRCFALLALLCACILPAGARAVAADSRIALSNPCFRAGAPGDTVERLARQPSGFDCRQAPRTADADVQWIYFDVKAHGIRAADRWIYDHTTLQARDEQVWMVMDDGRILPSLTPREQARTILAGPTQSYHMAAAEGQVSALLIRIDGLENRRGPVPRASLLTQDRAWKERAAYFLVWGILAGTLTGILCYNLTLYFALRYPVILAYCLSIGGVLFYGVVGSNLILLVFPSMTTGFQFGLYATSISLSFLASVLYFRSFLEDGMVPPRLLKGMVALSVVSVALSATRMVTRAIPWQLFDAVNYAGYLAILGLLLVGIGIAWQRGSRAARFFALAWALPVLVIVARIFWGMGGLQVENTLFDLSTYAVMSFEALLSVIGLSWRLRQLRSERDAALNLADIDSMTGLLNRRAFLQSAVGQEEEKRLVLIDIDHFKGINDRYGHDVGDRVITATARLLRNFSPDNALIGRLGGEEFAVLVPASDGDQIGERLRRVVARVDILPDGERVTISAGMATGRIGSEEEWRQLYVAADTALYTAKRNGRNKVATAAIQSLAVA